MTYEGNCRLGDLFSSRREKGRPGLPTLSVTLNDGLVNREDLDRKQDTNLSPEEHLLVRPGDIAYNMMRMWQGAFGLVDEEGLVSPAYVVLTPKGGIDPAYAAYLFKTRRMLYLFWAYSYGLTDDRLRLYYPDFAKIPVTIHPVAEQQVRARTLAAFKAALETHKKLLDNSKAMKRALLQKLLRPHAAAFPAGWHEMEFGDFVHLVRDQFDPKASPIARWCIELEHIEQGTGRLIGSTTTNTASSIKRVFQTGDVLFSKLRPYLQKFWLAQRDGVCSSEIWIFRPDATICLPEFLPCLLQSPEFMRSTNAAAGSKMPRAEWEYVQRTPLLLPPLDIQHQVAELLRTFDAEISTRADFLEILSSEFTGLTEQILAQAKRTKQ